ncbi:MAG: energy-coupling factor transporter transmembrane protein EcfT [Tissierellia bacterium]|nr:energy-coupling factor transporter transmembrane protein EcfT [Tissierellia bacterium]
MLKDITVGQYFPTGSVIHKTDPRIKILIIFIYIVFLFLIQTFIGYGFMVLWVIAVTKASKLPIKMIFKGLKPLRWIILITFTINVLFTQGTPLFSLGPISASKEGFILALRMAVRLALLVLGTSLLTLTTSPVTLTDGIEGLLNPLKKVGFPVHELAMMITIALRFIPTLIDETDKILKAQMARGADFESGNIINRAKNMVPLIVPLLLSSINRADELSIAMEARCYNGDKGRTKLNPLELKPNDFLILGISLAYFVAIILFERYIWLI